LRLEFVGVGDSREDGIYSTCGTDGRRGSCKRLPAEAKEDAAEGERIKAAPTPPVPSSSSSAGGDCTTGERVAGLSAVGDERPAV